MLLLLAAAFLLPAPLATAVAANQTWQKRTCVTHTFSRSNMGRRVTRYYCTFVTDCAVSNVTWYRSSSSGRRESTIRTYSGPFYETNLVDDITNEKGRMRFLYLTTEKVNHTRGNVTLEMNKVTTWLEGTYHRYEVSVYVCEFGTWTKSSRRQFVAVPPTRALLSAKGYPKCWMVTNPDVNYANVSIRWYGRFESEAPENICDAWNVNTTLWVVCKSHYTVWCQKYRRGRLYTLVIPKHLQEKSSNYSCAISVNGTFVRRLTIPSRPVTRKVVRPMSPFEIYLKHFWFVGVAAAGLFVLLLVAVYTHSYACAVRARNALRRRALARGKATGKARGETRGTGTNPERVPNSTSNQVQYVY